MFEQANNLSHFISRMSKQAILLASLLGLVAVVLTAPTENPIITTESTAIVEIVSNGAAASDRLKRLEKICHESDAVEASYCLAFKQLRNHLTQNIILQIDLLGQQLSKSITGTEDICSNLTELVKHLPSKLSSEELKYFAQDERCFSLCSKTNGSEDEVQSDDCRLLYIGFTALKASHPERERIEKVKPKINKEKQYAMEKPVEGTLETIHNIAIEENIPPEKQYIQEEEERQEFVQKSRTYDPSDFNNQNYYLYFLFSFVVFGTFYGIYRCTDDSKKV